MHVRGVIYKVFSLACEKPKAHSPPINDSASNMVSCYKQTARGPFNFKLCAVVGFSDILNNYNWSNFLFEKRLKVLDKYEVFILYNVFP